MFSLHGLCFQMPNAAIGIGYALYVLSEYIMGKTRFGSWIGILIETPAKKLFRWVVGPVVPLPVIPPAIPPAAVPQAVPAPEAPSGPKPST